MTQDRAVDQVVANFGAWVDCILAMPEGPDKEEELKLLHRVCDDPLLAWINRIDDMPEGSDKEAERALFDKLLRSNFVSAWKNHILGILGPDKEAEQRRRRQGGGRKPAFAPDRLRALQQTCRDLLRQNPTLRKNNDTLVGRLRASLKSNERVSSAILLRNIVRPVLRPRAE